MTRLELLGMYTALLDNSHEWFDPRDGHENMEKQAWRAVAYYVAGVAPTTEQMESTKRILNSVTA